jgi:tetratricopeptide (TPR) repeat protein
MTADDACQALQRLATLLGRQHRPRLLQRATGRLGSARGGAMSAVWERMRILLDQSFPDACGTIPPTPTALESRLWAKKGRIDKADIRWPVDWHSLEWELGQEYLRARGSLSFLADARPVPWYVNNDGTLSRNAAEVFFQMLEEEKREQGTRDTEQGETIYVLELGVGVGLFARFFLDHFKELSLKNGREYYDRLCYIAADKSVKMLHDMARHGVLANHAGRYRLRVVDAMEPGNALPFDVALSRQRSAVSTEGSGDRGQGLERKAPFRAVFLNYLLDCLPAAVLEVEGEVVRQLCVRTLLGRNVDLARHTDMSLGQLQEKARSSDPKVRRELLDVYGLFASEYGYVPLDEKMKNEERRMKNEELTDSSPLATNQPPLINAATPPYLDFALELGRKTGGRLLHSHGAIQSLERLLDLVEDGGFILINDYGQTQMTGEEEFEHQRFSLATFVGVNFPLLKEYFAGASAHASRLSPLDWVEPFGEAGGIHSRLLGCGLAPNVRGVFQERFGEAAHKKREEPVAKARECQKVGRFEMAASYYRQALEAQPSNWVLMNEVSMFLTFSLRDAKAGINLARLGLELNPTCSADLWSTLGDGLFEFGRIAEAKSAYERALELNDNDVRARYNLAWVHQREGNFEAALEAIAGALARDKTGEYRERLLQKQQEVLAGLAQKNQQEYLLMVNLVSRPSGETRNSNLEIRNKPETRNPNPD